MPLEKGTPALKGRECWTEKLKKHPKGDQSECGYQLFSGKKSAVVDWIREIGANGNESVS